MQAVFICKLIACGDMALFQGEGFSKTHLDPGLKPRTCGGLTGTSGTPSSQSAINCNTMH